VTKLAEELGWLDFKVAVLAVDGCCLAHDDPADCDGDVQVHHAVTQQQLRKAGLDRLVRDPRNGMAVCYRAHRRHHNRTEPIALARVPARCVLFAREHGLYDLLVRYYAPAE
jgi:hypothetical protein